MEGDKGREEEGGAAGWLRKRCQENNARSASLLMNRRSEARDNDGSRLGKGSLTDQREE